MGTTYVFDTNSFRVFGNYYPEAFPSFWERVEELVGAGRITSCREVAKELELQNAVNVPGSGVRRPGRLT
jgi:pseudouridine-5'-phosphate glycosidase